MDLRAQLIRDEGKFLHLYRCPAGKFTIGVGHNIQDCGITDAMAEFILTEDINEKSRELSNALPWTDALDTVYRDALLNLAFNMGVGGLLTFKKMLAHAKAGEWIEAAQELIDSDYGHGVTRNRAARIAKQMVTGEYQ